MDDATREVADIAEPIEYGLDESWLIEDHAGALALDDVDLDGMRAFLFERWQERAAELYLPEPTDLRSACKFSALFVKAVLGGAVRGNEDHLHNVVDGRIVDLCATENAHLADPYLHDEDFFEGDTHIESLESNLPRVARWAEAYVAGMSATPTR